MVDTIIRPTSPGDVPHLQVVVDETGMFPSEMLPEMIGGFLSGNAGGEIWLTCEADGKAIGLCYAAPEALADGTWNMLALAVHPAMQRGGKGAAMVQHLETILREQAQRILVVDTSGTDAFALTRRFYLRNGYTEEARIRDFWADGDDKVTFWKSLR